MKIHEYHGSYNIQRRYESVKYIVLHYVGAGSSKPGNALANCKYFSRGDRQASAHYFVDDSGIWEYADPSTYFTWHCGDGHGAYGITNSNSIGIEVCVDGDTPYTELEVGYLKELVPYLMKKYGVPASRVVRHYDASRKMCPYYYAKRQGAWEALKAVITATKTTPTKTSTTTKKPTKKAKTLSQVAQEVIEGKWGNGDTRKRKLRSAGYDYDSVQKEVNRLLSKKSTPKKSVHQVALEVIDGKWGNGTTRVKRLKAAGYDASAVQKEVNRILR